MSEANTIQAIPIPKNKSDVEAFLDDIFERALDTSESLINPANANKTPTRPLQSRIKGGGKPMIVEIQSWDDVNSLNDYSLNDSNLVYSAISATTTTTSCSSDENVTDKSSELSSVSQPTSVGLIIPNKEYEYTKMLRMFLGNKNLISQLKDDANEKSGDCSSGSEEKLIYSVVKPFAPFSFASSSAVTVPKNSQLSFGFTSSSVTTNDFGFDLFDFLFSTKHFIDY